MPNSILSSLLSKPTLSIVSSTTGLDLATNLQVQRVGIKFRSRVFRHKREDGTSIVDARILVPTVVDIDVFCKSLDDLALVNAMMLDRTSVYRVTTKGVVLLNMMMSDESVKQTPDVISANPVRMTLMRLLTQNNSEPPSVAQAADSSLLDRGIQQVRTTANSAVTNVQQLASQTISNLGI